MMLDEHSAMSDASITYTLNLSKDFKIKACKAVEIISAFG